MTSLRSLIHYVLISIKAIMSLRKRFRIKPNIYIILFFLIQVYSWKLSRTRDLSANATTKINRVINSINVLNQRYYSSIEHSDSACFYYPEADGSPVVFRGQCDGNIPVVTNFNATAVSVISYIITKTCEFIVILYFFLKVSLQGLKLNPQLSTITLHAYNYFFF